MNRTEHALTTTAEECAEIAKEISKAMRFGLDDKLTLDPKGPPGTEGPTNREKIVAELNDLMGMVKVLIALDAIPENWQDIDAQMRKGAKFCAFLEYSERKGTVTPS
jgi:NTP pyrophosphatase (non-canonical NTP hydrolase)